MQRVIFIYVHKKIPDSLDYKFEKIIIKAGCHMQYTSLGNTNICASRIGIKLDVADIELFDHLERSTHQRDKINLMDISKLLVKPSENNFPLQLKNVLKEYICIISNSALIDVFQLKDDTSFSDFLVQLKKILSDLGLERLDLLMIETDKNNNYELFSNYFKELKEIGLIRSIGKKLLNNEEISGYSEYDFFSLEYNYLNRIHEENGFMDHCYEKNLPILISAVLPQEFVKYERARIEDVELMKSMNDEKDSLQNIYSNLKIIADWYNLSVSELLICWNFSRLGVTNQLLDSGHGIDIQDLQKCTDYRISYSDITRINEIYYRSFGIYQAI